MIIVWGSMTARSDSLDELLKISLEHVHRSREEPGCLLHSVQIDVENKERLVFYEEWQDMAALQAHFKVAESGQFVQQAKQLSESGGFDMSMYEANKL